MKIMIKDLENSCVKILMKKGLSKKEALLVYNDFLDSELEGKPDHGFQSFLEFGIKLVQPQERPKIIKQSNSFLFIDGKNNYGQIVCDKYIPILIKKARRSGVAIMGIKNMHSYRSPGKFAQIIAQKNLIGIIMNYGGWPRIAPYGSIDPILGTNPIAIGIPSKNFPVVLDMATSKVALMKIRMAKKLNKKIPYGWAIDKNGKPTDDPNKVFQGAVLPFGEHKGSGLALIVELLTKTIYSININDRNKANRGFLFICIDPSIFQNLNKYKIEVEKVIRKIKKSRKAKGKSEIFIPGEYSYKEFLKNKKRKYIEIDKKTLFEIRSNSL